MGNYLTAQILIGNPIISMMDRFVSHFVIYLAENSRPSFLLNAMSMHQDGEMDFEQVVWVPTLENTLEDALLMIAICIHKDKTFIDMAETYFELSNKVECYEISQEGREALYSLLENYEFKGYIIVSVFDGSLLSSQVERLNNYHIDGEICLSTGRIVQP